MHIWKFKPPEGFLFEVDPCQVIVDYSKLEACFVFFWLIQNVHELIVGVIAYEQKDLKAWVEAKAAKKCLMVLNL